MSTQDSRNCEKHSDLILSNDSEAPPRADSGSSDISPVDVAYPVVGSSSAVTTTRKSFGSSRRSSSIADISPYLSRPAEVPTSGKRLKQLALLESVADESSKMTPTLISRELPPIHGPDCHHIGYSGPSASVPPPTSYAAQVSLGALIDSGTSVPCLNLVRNAHLPPLHASHEHPTLGDPFQVRPRSSQLNHATATYINGVPTRSARNPNQALPLFGVPPHIRSPVNVPGRHLPTPSSRTFTPSYSTSPLHSAQSSTVHPIYPYASALEQAVPSAPPHSFCARDPQAVPAAQAVFPPQSRSSLPSSSVQLLSILNGDRVGGAHASVSRTGHPSTSISVHAT